MEGHRGNTQAGGVAERKGCHGKSRNVRFQWSSFHSYLTRGACAQIGGGRDGLPLVMNNDGGVSPILNQKHTPVVVPTAAAHAQVEMTTEVEEKAAVTTSGSGILTTKSVSSPSQ